MTNDNEQLQAGIDMRRALLAQAASAGGNLVPREAEFFEAGYQAGTAAATSASAPANDWCPECHALNSADLAAGLDTAQIAALISRYTGLRKATAPDEFAELERLVCAVMMTRPAGVSTSVPAGAPGLLPCPFCGSAAEIYPDGEDEGYDVMCSSRLGECKLSTFAHASQEQANAAWNLRASGTTASASAPAPCWCTRCLDAGPGVTILGMRVPASSTRMILCPTCGNKRCPKANDHDNACSGSNDPGQPGSAWASWPATSKPE